MAQSSPRIDHTDILSLQFRLSSENPEGLNEARGVVCLVAYNRLPGGTHSGASRVVSSEATAVIKIRYRAARLRDAGQAFHHVVGLQGLIARRPGRTRAIAQRAGRMMSEDGLRLRRLRGSTRCGRVLHGDQDTPLRLGRERDLKRVVRLESHGHREKFRPLI